MEMQVGDGEGSTGRDEVESEEEQPTKCKENEVPKTDTYNVADRKVIYTADIRIKVTEYEMKMADLEKLITNHNGYIVESTRDNDSEEEKRTGSLTARIPQEQFHVFMDKVERVMANY
ncbi:MULTISPECIES: DUF4349 domain-containing protein [Clostridia]|uniref:DUF4349 domain-containing protein n=1 Tax=Clostridia TaxID=186801 RepID=UPI001314F1B8|nr:MULTISPECIES: DUF4349 domain-containing protein [Clostridia]